MAYYEKKRNQHKIGTTNGKDLFVSILQTSYRTYIHLYINISVRKDMLATLTS